MKKRLLALTLAGALLLSGCSGLKTRQPDEDALPELEYTRPENEKIENRESQKTLKSQGTLSDGSDYILYANNELEISGDVLTSKLKSEKPLTEALKDVTVLTLNVKEIGEETCGDLSMIQSVNLGPDVTSIGDSAFSKCSALGTIQFGVFDGMGGENYGEQASFTAASEMQALTGKPKLFYQSGGKYLGNLALALNDAVFRRAQELMTSRMGTTMAALYFSGNRVYVCNVGDSRVYRLRDHVFAQLSQDHVSKRVPAPGRKAPLTQHLGMNPEDVRIEPFVIKDSMQSGDIYLMCSDGLTDMVDNLALSDILSRSENPEQCALNLLQAALDGGGKDNITIIVCRIQETSLR